mgnify:CR=1 FL=1
MKLVHIMVLFPYNRTGRDTVVKSLIYYLIVLWVKCTWLYLLSKHMFLPLNLYPGTFARTLESVCTLWPIKIANFLVNSMKVFYQCHDPRSKIVLFRICPKNPNFALFLFKSGYVVPYTLKEHVLSSKIIPDQKNYVLGLLVFGYKVSLIHVSKLYIVGTQ